VIDPAVGLVLEKKVGDPVAAGERVCVIYSNDRSRVARVRDMIRGAMRISPEAVTEPTLLLGELGG